MKSRKHAFVCAYHVTRKTFRFCLEQLVELSHYRGSAFRKDVAAEKMRALCWHYCRC